MVKQVKIGLALGSGSIRGLTHIGVLKVLTAEKIPIDFLAGSSAGAIVAAYFAVHGEIESLENFVLKMKKVDFAPLVDFVSPRKALIKGKKIQKFLDNLFEHRNFHQLKMPLKIVTVDLRTGKEVDLARGKVAEAVMASITVPGILPPISIGRKLLVDGGVTNPTPVDVVKKMGAEIVLGVDLTMTGKAYLHNPSIIETITRSFEILRTQTTKLTSSKIGENLVIIKPKISRRFSSLSYFNQKIKVIKKGEKAARKALPKIRKLLDRS